MNLAVLTKEMLRVWAESTFTDNVYRRKIRQYIVMLYNYIPQTQSCSKVFLYRLTAMFTQKEGNALRLIKTRVIS